MKSQTCETYRCPCCQQGCQECEFCKANLHCRCKNRMLPRGIPKQPCHCPYCPMNANKQTYQAAPRYVPIGHKRLVVRNTIKK